MWKVHIKLNSTISGMVEHVEKTSKWILLGKWPRRRERRTLGKRKLKAVPGHDVLVNSAKRLKNQSESCTFPDFRSSSPWRLKDVPFQLNTRGIKKGQTCTFAIVEYSIINLRKEYMQHKLKYQVFHNSFYNFASIWSSRIDLIDFFT